MSAFLQWLNSTEPATPGQAAAIVATFSAVVCFNMWLACRFSGSRKEGDNEM